MSTILFSDIHLTTKAIDFYRWDLLPWLSEQAKKLRIDQLIFCGDATDSKDRHESALVNKFVDQLYDLTQTCQLFFIKGNHDFIDQFTPFFRFLNKMSNVTFITMPTTKQLKIDGKIRKCIFLPSTKNYKEDWGKIDFRDYELIACHQTFEGALSENGFPLPGIPTNVFGSTKAKIYSGDIHSPGFVGPVEYVGSPYRTSFGSNFTPRVLYMDDSNVATDLHYPCPSRHTVTIRTLKDFSAYSRVKAGDQVKIRVRMRREDLHEYPALRDEVREELVKRQWVECGFELAELVPSKKKGEEETIIQGEFRTPEQLVREYAENHDLTKDQEELGVSLLAV